MFSKTILFFIAYVTLMTSAAPLPQITGAPGNVGRQLFGPPITGAPVTTVIQFAGTAFQQGEALSPCPDTPDAKDLAEDGFCVIVENGVIQTQDSPFLQKDADAVAAVSAKQASEAADPTNSALIAEISALFAGQGKRELRRSRLNRQVERAPAPQITAAPDNVERQLFGPPITGAPVTTVVQFAGTAFQQGEALSPCPDTPDAKDLAEDGFCVIVENGVIQTQDSPFLQKDADAVAAVSAKQASEAADPTNSALIAEISALFAGKN